MKPADEVSEGANRLDLGEAAADAACERESAELSARDYEGKRTARPGRKGHEGIFIVRLKKALGAVACGVGPLGGIVVQANDARSEDED